MFISLNEYFSFTGHLEANYSMLAIRGDPLVRLVLQTAPGQHASAQEELTVAWEGAGRWNFSSTSEWV